MAQYKFGNVRPDKILDINDEEQLKNLYLAYFPAHGSGPLGPMSMLCKVIEEIAKDKGYNIQDWSIQYRQY
jgi:hypothetical protein